VLASVVSVVSFVRSTDLWERRGLQLLFLAAGTLGIGLAVRWFNSGLLPVISQFEVVAFYTFVITIVYLVNAIRYDTRNLSVILIPYVTVLLFIAVLHSRATPHLDPHMRSIWLNVHILAALVGYASFTLACVLGVSYLLQDRNLKQKRFGPLFRKLPALETLDRLMSGQIAFAFVVFTVSIGLGILLTHLNRWGTRWLTDPKIIATVLTWFIYAVLFYLKVSARHHGRKIAIITIVGFCGILFTFFGVNLFTQTMHNLTMARYSGGGG